MSEAVRTYVEPPKLGRTLRHGMKGEDVKLVQQILQREGYFNGTPLGNFKGITRDALKHFQGTHIGKDGEFLKADGVVGPITWWALHNPNGSAQRSFIVPPAKATSVQADSTERDNVLRFLYARHRTGVQEVPGGSNYGDGVTACVNACGFTYGIYWCLAEQSYAEKEANGKAPLGAMHVHCSTFWNEANKRGMAHPKDGYIPIPGDIAIYNYSGGLRSGNRLVGAGHAARVVRVSETGNSYNMIEGNVGNRLKLSVRNRSESTLVGFVNLYHDEENRPHYQTGLSAAPTVVATLADSR
jgi:peptidoglycan hydrolase-like protein with peptidoglycan-binding domain